MENIEFHKNVTFYMHAQLVFVLLSIYKVIQVNKSTWYRSTSAEGLTYRGTAP